MLEWEVPTLVTGSLSLGGWIALHIRQSRAEAYRKGQDAERVEQQRRATERQFEHIEEIEASLADIKRVQQGIREVLIANEMMLPTGTQSGEDGRGARNPLRGHPYDKVK
jgi:hypothetical protein